MITLYHGGAAANSLKALLPLFEKNVDFKSHLMALINFEQHEPWFVKINPRGQVPVLVHDDRVLDESTLINEYVDDTFPGLPLKPSDAYGRHQMRLWTKFVDEYFCPALSFLGWHAMIKNAVAHLSKEEFEAKVARIPLKEQQDKWRESASQVWTPEQLADWRRKVKVSIDRIENGMLGEWMMGQQFTLADVSCFSMLINMPVRYADIVNEKDSPKVIAWYNRMLERDSVKKALAIGHPGTTQQMTARIIDGKAVAAKLRIEYRGRIERMVADHGLRPGLCVILVGEDPASQVYVRNKIRDCSEVGIRSTLIELPASIPEAKLLAHIDELNADDQVHGILIQLPLPPHVAIRKVLERISVDKDVDGFHLYNVGGLVTGHQVFPPCTPYGVQKLLEHENIELDGRNVVVVGASNIVGKPTAMMLMQQDATVSICHKKTRDLGQYTLLADILVVAAGVPGLIIPQMVRTGAVVIDVGINRLPDGRIVGDVDFEGVRKKASFISPVPGGVGPMTRAMLLHNTLTSAERAVPGRESRE